MSLKEQDRESLVVLGLEKSYKMLDEMSWLKKAVGVWQPTGYTMPCFMQ